jgi:hypothetical protein
VLSAVTPLAADHIIRSSDRSYRAPPHLLTQAGRRRLHPTITQLSLSIR